jgi:hypothetical protein
VNLAATAGVVSRREFERMIEDDIQAEARALAREQGLNPDEIVEGGECEAVVDDRGDGVPVISMHHPLRARWTEFEAEARRRVQARRAEKGPG